MAGTLVVTGFKELVASTSILIPSERAATREALESVGEIVRLAGARDLVQYKASKYGRPQDAQMSASSFKVRVRQRGVEVEQSLRKTTGLHPEWGRTQMKHGLIPALYQSELEVTAEFDRAMDKVVIAFNR
jgi:hypothetical protein